MPEPIEQYLSALERRLTLARAERDATLTEARAHLTERAASLRAGGLGEEEAQQQAVRMFGDVRRISRQFNRAHPQEWGRRRWLIGALVGAAATWAIWVAGTLPAMIYYFHRYPVYTISRSGAHILNMPRVTYSTPISLGGFDAYLALGWLWLAPLLALFAVIPFVWGSRARRWWAPGIAYGLGAWLSVPWFALEAFSTDWAWSAEGRIIALGLPLASAASYGGWLWRRRVTRRAEDLAIAQA